MMLSLLSRPKLYSRRRYVQVLPLYAIVERPDMQIALAEEVEQPGAEA
jgi:hypothetical protein